MEKLKPCNEQACNTAAVPSCWKNLQFPRVGVSYMIRNQGKIHERAKWGRQIETSISFCKTTEKFVVKKTCEKSNLNQINASNTCNFQIIIMFLKPLKKIEILPSTLVRAKWLFSGRKEDKDSQLQATKELTNKSLRVVVTISQMFIFGST